jgi:hypothetical protein
MSDRCSDAPENGVSPRSTTSSRNLTVIARRILLLRLSRAFYAPSAQAIIHPTVGEEPDPARRHAVIAAAHGTVDGERAILVRNSWGARWGAAGYGWLTETFLAPRLFAATILTENVDVSACPVAA